MCCTIAESTMDSTQIYVGNGIRNNEEVRVIAYQNHANKFLFKYGQLYKGQPIAICCWNGDIKPEPLLWWYKPTDKDIFFIPTMDAHNGEAPDINEIVKVDHIISVGASDKTNKVTYDDEIPDNIKGLLPEYVFGTKIFGKHKNGDMFYEPNKLGDPYMIRVDSLKANYNGSVHKLAGWN